LKAVLDSQRYSLECVNIVSIRCRLGGVSIRGRVQTVKIFNSRDSQEIVYVFNIRGSLRGALVSIGSNLKAFNM